MIRVATAASLIDANVLHPNILQPDPENPRATIHEDEWFMDYRNADGSIAEMCGNGVRAFAHVLIAEKLIGGENRSSLLRLGWVRARGEKL